MMILLSTAQLSKRLKVTQERITNNRYSAHFAEWSKELDPENIAWQFTGKVFREYV